MQQSAQQAISETNFKMFMIFKLHLIALKWINTVKWI